MDRFLKAAIERREREHLERLASDRSLYANPCCPDCGRSLNANAQVCWECVNEGRVDAPRRTRDEYGRKVFTNDPLPVRPVKPPREEPKRRKRRNGEPPAPCSVTDCGAPARTKGKCQRCYVRERRGYPDAPPRLRPDPLAPKCVECLNRLGPSNTTGVCSECQLRLRLRSKPMLRAFVKCKAEGLDFERTLDSLFTAWIGGEVRLGG